MWFWEPGNLPRWQVDALSLVDELWVASRYLEGVFGQYGKVPVKVVGLAVDLPTARDANREDFGLHDDEFVFLFVYDALSSHGRKNPEKVIEAFVQAFAPTFDGVRLVLKVSNLNKFPASKAKLETSAPSVSRQHEGERKQSQELKSESSDDAVKNAMDRANQTLRGLTGLEVTKMNASIGEDGQIAEYRAHIRITFRLEG